MKFRRSAGFLFFLIFLIVCGTPLCAGGRKEGDRIETAQRLIGEKRYTEAVAVLTEVLKKEPQRFDEATALLREVREFQNAYNRKYNELLETYETDLAQSYVIIKELEDMNPYADEATKANLLRARETAGFVYNRRRWEGIMSQAQELINQGAYWEAVEVYRGGFDLSQDIFDDANYDSFHVDQAYARHAALDRELDRFAELRDVLETRRLREREAFENGNFSAYNPAFGSLLAAYRELTEILLFVQDSAGFYGDLAAEIEESQGSGQEVHHLVYRDLLLAGRGDAQTREGIGGVLDMIWSDGVAELTEHTDSLTGRSYQRGLEGFKAGNYSGSEGSFRLSVQFARLDGEAVNLWSLRLPEEFRLPAVPEGGRFPEPPEGMSESQGAIYRLWQDQAWTSAMRLRGAGEFPEIIASQNRINALGGRVEGLRQTAGAPVIRGEILAEREHVSSVRENWGEARRGLAPAGEPDGTSSGESSEGASEGASGEAVSSSGRRAAEDVFETLDGQLRELLTWEIDLVRRVHTLDQEGFRQRLGGLTERYNLGLNYLEGVPLSPGTGEGSEIIAQYPQRALTEFNAITPQLEQLAGEIRTERNGILEEAPEIQSAPAIRELASQAEAMLADIQGIQNAIPGYAGTAENRVFVAERYRQEGDTRVSEARQLFNRGEYRAAKERLELASDRFYNSLAVMEDPELRAYRDRDIPQLYAQIQTAENNLVIAQVREYLTQAETLYRQNDYFAANDLFLRAQSRWADTNTEENAEIQYWLNLTRTALTVTTGREISPTDPLYPEMAQYLNQATEDYNQGIQSTRTGRTGQAEEYYANAEKNILYVQQFFPYNTEARVLSLRITQQRNPNTFQELFARDFQAARAKISQGPQEAGEAYNELKNLEAIYPNYPGLAAAILESEYAAGMRTRPPDTRRINEARENFQRAQTIYNSGNRDNFPVAQGYLDRALELNPNYPDAQQLKDRIAIAIGGTSTGILSSADEQQYQIALEELNAGNRLRAQIIVETLLNKPENRNVAKLLELQRRIETSR